MVFIFMSFCIVDYIDGFPYIEPSLHPLDKAYQIMVNDHFDAYLDLVCKKFIEDFCINIHEGNWSEVLFFVGSLCGLGIIANVASQNVLSSVRLFLFCDSCSKINN